MSFRLRTWNWTPSYGRWVNSDPMGVPARGYFSLSMGQKVARKILSEGLLPFNTMLGAGWVQGRRTALHNNTGYQNLGGLGR